jgi:hypothetical protein
LRRRLRGERGKHETSAERASAIDHGEPPGFSSPQGYAAAIRRATASLHAAAAIAARNPEMPLRPTLVILAFATLLASTSAFAQTAGSSQQSFGFGTIQCAGASELCGWKRIPGGTHWRHGRSHRRPRPKH